MLRCKKPGAQGCGLMARRRRQGAWRAWVRNTRRSSRELWYRRDARDSRDRRKVGTRPRGVRLDVGVSLACELRKRPDPDLRPRERGDGGEGLKVIGRRSDKVEETCRRPVGLFVSPMPKSYPATALTQTGGCPGVFVVGNMRNMTGVSGVTACVSRKPRLTLHPARKLPIRRTMFPLSNDSVLVLTRARRNSH